MPRTQSILELAIDKVDRGMIQTQMKNVWAATNAKEHIGNQTA